jgi:uncharacterized protein with gpF-like domain
VKRRGQRLLHAVRPNAGIRAAYRRKLLALVDEMTDSYLYWLRATYRRAPPELATDAAPRYGGKSSSKQLQHQMGKLGRQWEQKFKNQADPTAKWFAKTTYNQVQRSLKRDKPKGTKSEKPKVTDPMQEALRATVEENVALIKSIPVQFHTQVVGLVMRSVTAGRDLGQLTEDLQQQFGVARRRAELIARDQNNKATAAIARVRHMESGVLEAIWVHSGAGKKPRPTHKKAGRMQTRYKIAVGWYDPAVGRHIQPGELINCKCVGRPVVKGFS